MERGREGEESFSFLRYTHFVILFCSPFFGIYIYFIFFPNQRHLLFLFF